MVTSSRRGQLYKMLTENREKRKFSDKQGGRTKNSILEYSTEPRSAATEFDEVVMMLAHEGNNAGLDDDGERPDFRQIAWLLREKLNDFVDGDHGEPPELGLLKLLKLAASRKIVSLDPKMLNPVLWTTLPKELVLRVLARLPVPDITRLRSLSREWKRDMATLDSDINRACDEASPNMVALFTLQENEVPFRTNFLVTILDLSKHKSPYSYTLSLRNLSGIERAWAAMGAFDGGLVCFVSTWKPTESNPMRMVVMNLLTGDRCELPPLHYFYHVLPTMMRIKVDSETKYYKVVVVYELEAGRSTIKIYDSGMKKWTKEAPACPFAGVAYIWEYDFENTTAMIAPSVCDFTEGQLTHFSGCCLPSREGASAMSWALGKDCMFLLHNPRPTDFSDGEVLHQNYSITQYFPQSSAEIWVEGKSYPCTPFNGPSNMDLYGPHLSLAACEGFLIAFARVDYNSDSFCCFLDLSTGQWIDQPERFEGEEYETSMCRALWNVVP